MFLKRLVIPLLLGLTLLTFWRVMDAGFFLWDDHEYVVNHPHVKQGLTFESVKWALTTNEPGYPMSLTWLSFMLDHQLGGLNPAQYHRTNLILHALNSVWLYLLLRHLTGSSWRAALVAFIWALHPQRAESVAWIAERKDVLSAGMAMLTLYAYARYARQPSWKRYLPVMLALVAGLASKVMLVTLPFLMLVLDFWPLRRCACLKDETPEVVHPAGGGFARASVGRLVLEKVPLFAIVGLFCVLTYVGQHSRGYVASTAAMSLPARIANAVLSYGRYLEKMVRIDALGVFYPYPTRFPLPLMAAVVVLLVAVSLLAVFSARRRPWLLAGWCWYLGMLFPVIGLVQLSGQGFADRYSYLPTIGILVMLVWSIPESWVARRDGRLALGAVATALVTLLAAFTWVQVGYWRDNAALLRHTLQVTGPNFIVEYNLGNVLISTGDPRDLPAAAVHFRNASEISPNQEALFNLGTTLQKINDPLGAIDAYRHTLAVKPDHVDARNNLAAVLSQSGRFEEAVVEYRALLARNPDDPRAINNLGNALVRKGDFAGAIPYYERALKLQPGFVMGRVNLAAALANLGRLDDAIAQLEAARELAPNDAHVLQTLGAVRQMRDRAPR